MSSLICSKGLSIRNGVIVYTQGFKPSKARPDAKLIILCSQIPKLKNFNFNVIHKEYLIDQAKLEEKQAIVVNQGKAK